MTQEEHNTKYLIDDSDKWFAYEVADRTVMQAHIFEHWIGSHPFVEERTNLKEKSDKIVELMNEFYQEVSQYETKEEQNQRPKSEQSNE